MRQAISVVKKRSGGHERTIRELRSAPAASPSAEPLERVPGRADRARRRLPGRAAALGEDGDGRPRRAEPEIARAAGPGPGADGRDGALACQRPARSERCRRRLRRRRPSCAARSGRGRGRRPDRGGARPRTRRRRCWRTLARAAAVVRPAADRVHRRRREQPARSCEALEPLGNVTLLERPVRMARWSAPCAAALRPAAASTRCATCWRPARPEADRRKDEFLAMLGHELRNPLAAIRNALEVLDEVGGRRTTQEVAPARRCIDRQARHLVAPGGRPARRLPHHPRQDRACSASRWTCGDVVERCLAELGRRRWRAAAHDLDVGAAGRGRCWSTGDPVRLEQVVGNLLQNAVKYTPARRAASGCRWTPRGRRGGGAGARHRRRHPARRCCRASSSLFAQARALAGRAPRAGWASG